MEQDSWCGCRAISAHRPMNAHRTTPSTASNAPRPTTWPSMAIVGWQCPFHPPGRLLTAPGALQLASSPSANPYQPEQNPRPHFLRIALSAKLYLHRQIFCAMAGGKATPSHMEERPHSPSKRPSTTLPSGISPKS